ncbi:unnamed protein product [Lymnaea stagnalis]|uniref:Uncharacterized protein n=1 Tax=Lymnaea stagnalis TaxID=6523 RepID=A0AAV2I351_LYMST
MATDYDVFGLYNPPTGCGDNRCSTSFMEFIYCVVVPAVIVLALLALLAVIMCCNSKSCKCKKKASQNSQTNDIQLEDYNSIRRASTNLRQMSHNRETPLMGSRAGSMTLDRTSRRVNKGRDSCYSAPGTLQRQIRNRQYDQLATGPPPPYAYDNDNAMALQQRRSHLSEIDSPSPPPPPAYSMHPEDDFLGSEYFQSSLHASVRYDDSPGFSSSGTQPLLLQRKTES